MKKCTTCDLECKELHVHHIVPKVLGGLDIPGNLVSICEDCHSKIHSKKFLNHSELTKAGLAKAKARGVKLGGYREGHTAHHEAIAKKADEAAELVGARIESMRERKITFAAIAAAFNEEGVPTARGGEWYGTTVRNYYKRYVEKLKCIEQEDT